MTAIQLYDFINFNNIEYHFHKNEGQEDVIIFVNFYQLKDFNKLFSYSFLDEDGLQCVMKKGYFAFWMRDICEFFDIGLNEIFKR